jgi:hypothetical protein
MRCWKRSKFIGAQVFIVSKFKSFATIFLVKLEQRDVGFNFRMLNNGTFTQTTELGNTPLSEVCPQLDI